MNLASAGRAATASGTEADVELVGVRHDRALRGGDGVCDGEPAVELAAWHVEVEHAAGVGGGELGLGA